MNHWDLIPGETVTLRRISDGALARLRFRFRDTVWAAFDDEGGDRFQLFYLADDGGLVSPPQSELEGPRSWAIITPRADTRTVARDVPPVPFDSSNGVNARNPNWRRFTGV